MFNLAYFMILQLICESEKWLWESAYPRLGCWNPFVYSHLISSFSTTTVCSQYRSFQTLSLGRPDRWLWGIRKQSAEMWLEQGLIHKYSSFVEVTLVESMLKACCCSQGVWFLTAVHYHFLGGKEQRLNIQASRLDSACTCTCGLCWQEFWVLSRCRCDGSLGGWYHCGLP